LVSRTKNTQREVRKTSKVFGQLRQDIFLQRQSWCDVSKSLWVFSDSEEKTSVLVLCVVLFDVKIEVVIKESLENNWYLV
jgi:hypothetical protein